MALKHITPSSVSRLPGVDDRFGFAGWKPTDEFLADAVWKFQSSQSRNPKAIRSVTVAMRIRVRR
jgi:hypothetical protein